MSIKTSFNHIQIYVSNGKKSFFFYKELLTYLGYKVEVVNFEDPDRIKLEMVFL